MRSLPTDVNRIVTVEINVPDAAVGYGFSDTGVKWSMRRLATGSYEVSFGHGMTVLSAVASGGSAFGYLVEISSIVKQTVVLNSIGHTGTAGNIPTKLICTVLDKRL